MPNAAITINGIVGSNDALPLNTIVQLTNQDTGGETTYLWEVLDQPDGTADVLSSSTIHNPTFTPRKEGSYLLRLTVNRTLPTQVVSTAIAAVRHLKTNERAPSAFEVFEVDPAKGWKTAADRWLARINNVVGDANVVVCALPSSSVPILGDVVAFSGTTVLKSGLVGQETVLQATQAAASSGSLMRSHHLGVVVGTPTGAAPAANGLALVRRVGLVELALTGSPAVGDLVFVGDANRPALTPGTNPRVLGKVVAASGGTFQMFVDGSAFVLGRTDEMAAVADGQPVANWAPNLAGYMSSSASGDLLMPLRIRQGERLIGYTFSRFGNTSVDLVATIIVLSAAGTLSTPVTPTVVTDPPPTWGDTVVNSISVAVNPGDALYVDFNANAANARVGTVRPTFLITP